MIGLDTNVLCRYLLADDPVQTQKAAQIIDGAADQGEQCFISKIALCELVWVLENCTTMDRAEIVGILDRLLHTVQLEFEGRQLAHQALDQFRKSKGDFSDYLIHQTNLAAGCKKTKTFDKELSGNPGFEIL